MITITAYAILISFCLIVSNIALYFHNKRKSAILQSLRKSVFVSSNNELREIYSNLNESKFFRAKRITCGDYSKIIADSIIQRIYDMSDLCKHHCANISDENVTYYTYAYNIYFIEETLRSSVEYKTLKTIISNAGKLFSSYAAENFPELLSFNPTDSIPQIHKFLSSNYYHSTSEFYCTDSLSNIANKYLSQIANLEKFPIINPLCVIEITRLFLSWIPNEHLISDYRLSQ